MFRRHGYLTVLWVEMLTTLPVANTFGQIFLPGAAVCRRGAAASGRPWGGICENRDLGAENSQFSVTESG